MTRKKCIKMIMGTMGLPQPWEAEKVFRATREWMYGETGPWPSNQAVVDALEFGRAIRKYWWLF